jgi:hypothetical protein
MPMLMALSIMSQVLSILTFLPTLGMRLRSSLTTEKIKIKIKTKTYIHTYISLICMFVTYF